MPKNQETRKERKGVQKELKRQQKCRVILLSIGMYKI